MDDIARQIKEKKVRIARIKYNLKDPHFPKRTAAIKADAHNAIRRLEKEIRELRSVA